MSGGGEGATATLRLDDFLPYRLAFTSNLVSDHIARAYKALFDLTIPEWRVVAHVAEAEGITQQAIAARSRMDKVTISRATAALVSRGLLVRSAHDADGRARRLALSEAGRQLYAAVAPKALDLERGIFGRIDPADVAALHAILRRIDAAVGAAEG